LNLEKAYSEAGIDVIKLSKAPKPIVPDGYGGSDPDAKWSDSELHAAMVEHFSSWKNQPGWNVWLFSAKDYEIPQTYGMMFDEIGRHRQGCAVFYDSMNGSGAFETRLQLYACVHELGHCFNLLHSFQKSRAIPPAGADSSSSLSWMNYPRRYPSGEDGFWEDFPFQFTDSELIHLRHGLRDNVIFGGNDFSVGAALSGSDVSEFDAPSVDRSELRLRLESVKASFAFGEPVVVEIKLTNIGKTIKTVYDGTCLHPKMGLVQIAIRDPNGHIRIWKPLFEHLFSPRLKAIDKEHPFYQSAFIGYGREGFYFNQPGMYQIRAQYSLNDGVNIVSNIQTIRVRYPHNDDEEEAADLLLGQEQGVLLYLKGSDPPILKKGHKALNRLMQQYPRNPLTVYAKFITGFNQGRTFKKITADHKIIPRKPNLKVAERLLGSVIQLSEEGKGLDNISLNQTMVRLAKAQKSKGKENEAKKTMDHMMEFFGKKKFKHSIMETIEMQAKQALA
ncbi:MAG TPA: hypothetical protein VJL33_02520, partial [Candidatus Bathyarchaeia archaeon]|nr:hypothetical protein [Candidatus Bathyarchaeia archaeon]